MKQQLFFIALIWGAVTGAVELDDIFTAAETDNTELVQQYINEYGVEILEKRDWVGETPLHKAASNNAKKTVQFMLKKGGTKLLKAKNNHGLAKNNHGLTPLHCAAINDAKETVQFMLKKGGPKLLKAKDNFGNTPLHKAAWHNAQEAVQLILEKGDHELFEAKNNSGNTPLHDAARYNRQETVKLLLNKGVNIQAIDNDGKKPIDSTMSDKIKQLFINQQGKLNQQLLNEAKKNNYEGVVQTLDGGAQINTQDKNRRTGLHHATLQGNLTLIKGLLGRNADPTKYDSKDELAVHIAAGEPERLIPFIEAAYGQRLRIKE